MLDVTSLLIIGYKLSLLTFSIGTLIYALPVPWRGLKIWGPRLVWDSISAFIFLSIYYVLLEISNKIPMLLGGSWAYLISWMKSLIAFTLSLKEIVIIAYTAAKALGPLKMLSSLLWPIDRLSNVLWIFLASVYGLSIFIKSYCFVLLALGIVLYAIPFRLGRSAGSWLIAFALVFNAGLPLLPNFVSSFYQTGQKGVSPIVNYGLVYVKINITDYSGKPLDLGIVDFYVIDQGKANLVGKYAIARGGSLYSGYSEGYIPLPSKKEVYAYLEIYSLKMPIYPFPITTANLTVNGNEYYLRLVPHNLIWHKDGLILVTTASNVSANIVKDNEIRVYINDSDYYVDIRSPEGCQYSLSLKGKLLRSEKGNWTWLNLKGTYKRLYLKGEALIDIKVVNNCIVVPNYPKLIDYYVDFLGEGIFLDTDFLRSLIILFFTLPLIYIFLLFSIAYALAKLIGGRERIIPRFI
jgi:hypothetical protein